jgi:hypothetical protein
VGIRVTILVNCERDIWALGFGVGWRSFGILDKAYIIE